MSSWVCLHKANMLCWKWFLGMKYIHIMKRAAAGGEGDPDAPQTELAAHKCLQGTFQEWQKQLTGGRREPGKKRFREQTAPWRNASQGSSLRLANGGRLGITCKDAGFQRAALSSDFAKEKVHFMSGRKVKRASFTGGDFLYIRSLVAVSNFQMHKNLHIFGNESISNIQVLTF